MLSSNPAEAVQHLEAFDAESFHLWTRVPVLTPKAEKAAAFQRMAISNTEEAERLLQKAAGYLAAKTEGGNFAGRLLLEGATIRLTAATHCQELSGAWGFVHELETR